MSPTSRPVIPDISSPQTLNATGPVKLRVAVVNAHISARPRTHVGAVSFPTLPR